MGLMSLAGVDYTNLWAWFLIFVRLEGLMVSLPGIGTDQVPGTFRNALALALSFSLAMTGLKAVIPETAAEGGLMIACEFILGYLIGAIPSYIISSLAIAGQTTSGAIGLGQANMIDPSLGESIAVLARLGMLVGTVVFLTLDGHHILIRAASSTVGDIGLGVFRPDASTAKLLMERFSRAFELAIVISAPILVTLLVTQFVLGLITKFIPQVNIFIISLPLTIGIGLYITEFTFPGVANHMREEFAMIPEFLSRLFTATGA